jgi:hypothetical protein
MTPTTTLNREVPKTAQDYTTGRCIKIDHSKGICGIPWSTFLGVDLIGGKLIIHFVGYRVFVTGTNLEVLHGKIMNNTYPLLEKHKAVRIEREDVKVEGIIVENLLKQ